MIKLEHVVLASPEQMEFIIEGILLDKKKEELIRYPTAKEGAIYLVPIS